MRLFGLEIGLARKEAISLDTLIRRLEAAHETASGVQVTPENCMESPTVHAVVTGVTRRFSALPVHVFLRTVKNGRVNTERMPSHPVEKLLARPNEWQTTADYFGDAVSTNLRYGNFYAFTARGDTGPIRALLPLNAGQVEVAQDANWNVAYSAIMPGGERQDLPFKRVHHVRGPARNFLKGDSPVMDAREAIALEIAAERFGASFFGNGAMPGLVFNFMQGFTGFRTDEERTKFAEDFQAVFARKGRHKAFMLPNGIDKPTILNIENDRAQFLETRKLQRSIIAGILGVPPHVVGDLERATFSNIEEQSLDLVRAVILPIVRRFETAMERDLLTDEDRRAGVIIRFNLDGLLRGDFKSRQEGLAIMRQNGAINANEWRDHENLNPREDAGGEEYWQQGPSGQTGGQAPAEGDDE